MNSQLLLVLGWYWCGAAPPSADCMSVLSQQLKSSSDQQNRNTAVCMFDPERRYWTLNQRMLTVWKLLLTVVNNQTNEAQRGQNCLRLIQRDDGKLLLVLHCRTMKCCIQVRRAVCISEYFCMFSCLYLSLKLLCDLHDDIMSLTLHSHHHGNHFPAC